ncbi:MAG: MFS transporter, partial [Chloroflexi bacterium]|nr:MFS transporter [Chloroflexota bacterium]
VTAVGCAAQFCRNQIGDEGIRCAIGQAVIAAVQRIQHPHLPARLRQPKAQIDQRVHQPAADNQLATPAGSLSDRIGRRKLIVGGWLVYASIYLGFGLAQTGWQVWVLYALYGGYYGMAYGTASALVADLVPAELRGTAYGSYNAIIGLLAFPASVIAGVLWQGVGAWSGFGPSAPFIFGGTLALIAAGLMAFWMPRMKSLLDTDYTDEHR